MWAMDFKFDATVDTRRVKFLEVIEEHSRLSLAVRVGRRCKAKDAVAVLKELTSLCPRPKYIRNNSGPEFIAHALKRWCEKRDPDGLHRGRIAVAEQVCRIVQQPPQG